MPADYSDVCSLALDEWRNMMQLVLPIHVELTAAGNLRWSGTDKDFLPHSIAHARQCKKWQPSTGGGRGRTFLSMRKEETNADVRAKRLPRGAHHRRPPPNTPRRGIREQRTRISVERWLSTKINCGIYSLHLHAATDTIHHRQQQQPPLI